MVYFRIQRWALKSSLLLLCSIADLDTFFHLCGIQALQTLHWALPHDRQHHHFTEWCGVQLVTWNCVVKITLFCLLLNYAMHQSWVYLSQAASHLCSTFKRKHVIT
uniref:Secreted protein n=1 Tax=Eutreptiella gymnastica TaxID=73025 RepID=A0A7S4G6L5_9EUGL|mmetsp:Transcript_36375/g.59204  ORF Transcript_36375/g.59204 Transcript_36375/m.59204 type:complete len:106 (+) Transcript_36375:1800-2117(+)